MRGAAKKHDYRDRVLMRNYREAGASLEEICYSFSTNDEPLSKATLCRYLAELREVMGPEKLPKEKRHSARWYTHLRRRAQVSEGIDPVQQVRAVTERTSQ